MRSTRAESPNTIYAINLTKFYSCTAVLGVRILPYTEIAMYLLSVSYPSTKPTLEGH